VQLDAEAWERLATWIDLNAPDHGTWGEFVRIGGNQRERRCALRKLYGGPEEDAEEVFETSLPVVEPILPKPPERRMDFQSVQHTGRTGSPSYNPSPPRTVDLGGGVVMQLVRIPTGSFVMGQADSQPDERPAAVVKIEKPFWMGCCEVTNEQFARFDPAHQSRYEHRGSWIFSEEYLGWPLDRPKQPVVRVSSHEATAFCRWLSDRTGKPFTLPTEAQWEFACRAGTATPFSYGGLDTDFSTFANLADATVRDLAYKSWGPKTPDIVPRDERFNDGALVTAAVGSYRANPLGLFDMHGNAAEWTRSAYRSYPYREDDGRNAPDSSGARAVRGGSWRDRPAHSRSAARLSYPPHQKVFNVGFRVICEDDL
jgi:formylglycine-generating enzyme required for sulfatase activity